VHVAGRCRAILANAGASSSRAGLSDFLARGAGCRVTHHQESDVHAYFFLRCALMWATLAGETDLSSPACLEIAAAALSARPREVFLLDTPIDAPPARGARSLAMTTVG